MMLGVILWSCIILASEARSPNGDAIEELVKSRAFGSRISDNIIEDALLDLPSLVSKYNYPFEEHSVTTEDGYILGIHRIPHGRGSTHKRPNRSVVFVMHGLLSSSSDHVTMGPGSAIAYVLADAGFDVWMGNARGNHFSRRHIHLNPDSSTNTDFWKFSWDEIGNRDLPAMIDYVLQQTGKPALHYIGISQGTTAFFVMGSLRPDYNNKIITMHAFAPVAYMAYTTSTIFRALAPISGGIGAVASMLGIGDILPRSAIISLLGKNLCMDGAVTQSICSNLLFAIVGRNEDQHNATMLPVIFGHAPSGAALRQLVHYGQSITDGEFRRYDHGLLENIINYGSPIPPRYPLSRISAPVFLHYAPNDPLVEENDLERLFRELGNPVGRFLVPHPTFNHVDFMFGIDANTLVYDRVIGYMRDWEIKK